MSTNPSVPFLPAFNPYSLDPSQILASMQNTNLTANVYEGTSKTINAVSDAQRLLTTEIAGVNKNIYDTIAQNGIAIERNGANGQATTERVGYQLGSAVERNGALSAATSERVGSQVGVAVERNGGNILTAIEKVAGEGRLTTTIVDAASRQAANDSARDILRAVDRNGTDNLTTTKDAYNGLLASIERNSGENRMTTVVADTANQARLADTRRDISTAINNTEGELLATLNKLSGDTLQSIGNTAWETRQNNSAHFATLLSETQKNSSANALQSAQNYASMLLEGQKSKEHLASHAAMQFAAMISKTDGHAAGLSKQLDNHYASILLEQQKSKELISRELADAKYEALKNKMELSKEMGECCCEIKQKVDQRTQDVIGVVDTLDRNRLRDEVNTTTNENSLLKLAEFGPWGGFPGGYGGYGRGSRGRHGGRR